MGRYAQSTVGRSKAELEDLLVRYNADKFASGWESGKALIMFEYAGRRIRFNLPLPEKTEQRFTHVEDKRGNPVTPKVKERDPQQALKLWEQECRSAWRALVLVIKAKLEAVEAGITSFEEEFLAHIVTPGGKTVGERIIADLDSILFKGAKMPPMLGK